MGPGREGQKIGGLSEDAWCGRIFKTGGRRIRWTNLPKGVAHNGAPNEGKARAVPLVQYTLKRGRKLAAALSSGARNVGALIVAPNFGGGEGWKKTNEKKTTHKQRLWGKNNSTKKKGYEKPEKQDTWRFIT